MDLRTARIIGPIKPTNIKKEIIEDIENESGRRDRRGRQTKPVDQPVSPWLPQAQPVVQAAMAAQPDLMSTNWAALSLNQRDQLAVAADSQFRNGQIQRDQYDMIVRNLQALPGAAPWPGVGGIQVQPVMQNPYQFPVKREFDFCQFEPNDQRMMRGYAGGRMQVDLNRPSGKDPAEKEKTPAAIPANKTIYVGRTGYEVQYINDVAFIERNGLPHRIYFVGPPRDVVVDGTPYLLAFGETKTITIDGQQHTIRFGGPGRELIMGGFPFRGFFDGAPILATINNVAHKIQLCGPAPEVKIDPEPDYELSRDCAIAHKQNLQRNPYHDSRAAPTPGTSGMRPQQNYYSNENVYGMAPMVNPMLNAQTSGKEQFLCFFIEICAYLQINLILVVPQAMPQPLVNQQPMPLTTAVANVLPQWDRPAAVPLAATVAGVQPVVSTPAAIPQTVSPTPSATFSLDVNDLLKKLMTKGLIGNPQTAQASDSRQAETDVRASPPRRSDWSGRKDVGQPGVKHILEKRDAPPSTLIEFQLKDLKM